MRTGVAAIVGGLAAGAAAAAIAAFYAWSPPGPASEPAALTELSPTADLRFTRLETPRLVPALSFTDANGQPMTLDDFRGRVVLLNIWATWCVPCREEMPTLDRLQSKLGGSDFHVVALSIDRRGLDVVEPFYKELGIKSLGIYLDQAGKAPHELNTIGVPTTLLIDRDGREVARKIGPAEWDSAEMIALIRDYMRGPHGADAPLPGD